MNAKKTMQLDGEMVDFTKVMQGHVSQTVTQQFAIQRHRVIENRKLRLECREFVVKDQFRNLYVVFTAKLIDGEVYSVTTWVGSEVKGLVARFRAKYGHFNDGLLTYLQDEAFVAFGRATVEILKSRQAASFAFAPTGSEIESHQLVTSKP